jgi:broad specificity phosphatase PhoE
MFDLHLVRHGESTWNTLGLAQGRGDRAELTSRGQRQAAEAAMRLGGHRIRALYASDLRRAHGGTLRVLEAYLTGVPVEQMAWPPLENARVLRIPGYVMQSHLKSPGGIR